MKSSQPIPNEFKDQSRGVGVDMSPEAIARRLEIVDELREFAKELMSAKSFGSLVSAQPQQSQLPSPEQIAKQSPEQSSEE